MDYSVQSEKDRIYKNFLLSLSRVGSIFLNDYDSLDPQDMNTQHSQRIIKDQMKGVWFSLQALRNSMKYLIVESKDSFVSEEQQLSSILSQIFALIENELERKVT